ncbi:unnamed protein product [Prorocentrum cordatum]|uniref:Uncharacterized protein n=1 Tax=Prorocentrum cordatum TaxID=2364126 RepID=A0ABN9UQU6_9DINO|nr:unnamed protein product [Polarella glacialis]
MTFRAFSEDGRARMRSLFAAVPEAEAATDEAKQAGAEAPRSPTRRQREKRRSAPRTLQDEADAYHEMAQQANLLQSRQLRFAAARRLAAERTGVGAGEQLPVALGVVRELEDRLRALEGAIEGAGAAAGSPAAVAGGGGHTSRAIARSSFF